MTVTLHPVNGTFSGRALRQIASVNKAGATAARPLGCRTGVRPGTPAATVTATSTTWMLHAHAGVADVQVAAEAGGYDYAIDADVTGPVTAANGTMPRRDTLYLAFSDPGEDTSTASGIAVGYAVGVPATTNPVAPAIPTTRAMLLGYLAVPKSGGGAPVFIPAWDYAVAAGGIIPVRNATELAALAAFASAECPIYADQIDTRTLLRSVGAGWIPMAGGPWTDITVGSGFSVAAGYTPLAVRRVGNMIEFRGTYLTRAGATLAVTGGAQLTFNAAGSIPAAFRPVTHQRQPALIRYSDAPGVCEFIALADGALAVVPAAGGTLPAGAPGGFTLPSFSWPAP